MELRGDIQRFAAQRFAAVWLVRILTKSSMALHFGNALNRWLGPCLIGHLNVTSTRRFILNLGHRTQTFRKLPALVDHLHSILVEADGLIQVDLDLHRLNGLQQSLMRLFNKKSAQPFLSILLSGPLTHRNRISGLFNVR